DKYAAERVHNIYYPFASKAEWQLAAFMLRSGMTTSDIDEFMGLELIRACLPLSFKSAKELRGRMETLPTGPEWKSQVITYEEYPTKSPIVLYYRDPLECVQFLLRSPLLKKHLELIPKKRFRKGIRAWDEWITSEGAWEMQEALPSGATLLGVVATSDKTNISVMNGDRVAHPFLISLANIDMDFLMKASNHAFMMAALLPVPKFLCDKEIQGLMERRLFHHCLDIVCHSLKVAAVAGHPMSNSVGQRLQCHTPLVAYIVDTPEAADIACVMGKTSHLTMASHKTFGDAVRQEERTGAHTWDDILKVNAIVDPWEDVAEYQKESKKLRLSGVHEPFWRDWALSMNPARFLTPEVLHHLHREFYDHDFQWCRRIVGDKELDFRLSVIQPRVGFRHFKEGATQIKQLGGREHRELERCIVVVIADVAPREVVHAVRSLVDMRCISQAQRLDQVTLPRVDGSLGEFHAHKHSLIEAGGREQDHFYIPKLELMHGIVPSVKWAGVPMQYTADVTEKAHSTEIKVPARTETNHRDYDPQIVRYLDRAEKMRVFDLAIELEEKKWNPDAHDANDAEDEDSLYNEVSIAAGESTRPIRNLFNVAKAHWLKYPGSDSRMFTTSSTAFSLNRVPSLKKISIQGASDLFGLPDLRSALGDYFVLPLARGPNHSIIGGQRRSREDCTLPFTHLDVWFSVRVQAKDPHFSRPLRAQNLQAQPPDAKGDWTQGRYDTVLLCNDQNLPWPGEGHTVAQIRLILRPVWGKDSEPPTTAYFMYAQRYDVVPQAGSATGREPSTEMYIMKRATRTHRLKAGERIGDIVELKNIRCPAELVPRFGGRANPRFTPYNSLESCKEVRLNKYSSKELF
ncbi:hypothetical protein B0H12DRAFT_1001291, partial [Mycena haematopus]